MKRNKVIPIVALVMILSAIFFLYGCAPEKTELFKPVKIAEDDYEPENWGKAYPIHYELWRKTAEPTPSGKSKYKKGYDEDKIIYDKLSKFPYMALLFNGWGFGGRAQAGVNGPGSPREAAMSHARGAGARRARRGR